MFDTHDVSVDWSSLYC